MSNYQHERGWLDSEVWGNALYDERSAWSWMIGETEWKDTTKSANGRPVYLKRGQFTSSLRFMADKWQWDKNKVDRYLKKLKLWGMIEIGTDTGTGQTVVTVCNYDKYQAKKEKSGQTPGQGRDRGGTPTGQTRSPSSPSSQREEPAASGYRYRGKVMNWTAPDWERERDKRGLSERQLLAFVTARDDWLSTLPDDDKRKTAWWMATIQQLDKEAEGLRKSGAA